MSLLKTPPTAYIRAAPSWLANGKARPLLPVVSKRLQQPVKKAIIKSRTSLGSSSPAIPAMSALPKHVLLQDQSPISSEIMGEERQIYDIINKMNEGLLMPYSPETHVAFTLQTPTPPTPLHHPFDESIPTTAAERRVYDAVIKDEERTGMHSPEEAAATALPVHPLIEPIAYQLTNEEDKSHVEEPH